jgi:hypothetical protein
MVDMTLRPRLWSRVVGVVALAAGISVPCVDASTSLPEDNVVNQRVAEASRIMLSLSSTKTSALARRPTLAERPMALQPQTRARQQGGRTQID